MLASAAAGALATAAPAAAIQQCQVYQLQADYGVSTSPTQHVYVDDIDFAFPAPAATSSCHCWRRLVTDFRQIMSVLE
jgi:hypothetical protein